MSKVSEYLNPTLYLLPLPVEEPVVSNDICPHNVVITEELDGESVLICEDCGEDLTKQIIG